MKLPLVKRVFIIVGIAAFTVTTGAVLFAADDMGGIMMGPPADIKKESRATPPMGVREEVKAQELTKEMERPMSAPDPRSEQSLPDRQPLCGPWKNAINHVYCAPGYDVFSF